MNEAIDSVQKFLAHPFVLLWLGQLLHFVETLRALERAGTPTTARQYLVDHPAAVFFSIIAGVVVYSLATSMNQMTPLAAFGSGYMADRAVSAFATRGIREIERDPKESIRDA